MTYRPAPGYHPKCLFLREVCIDNMDWRRHNPLLLFVCRPAGCKLYFSLSTIQGSRGPVFTDLGIESRMTVGNAPKSGRQEVSSRGLAGIVIAALAFSLWLGQSGEARAEQSRLQPRHPLRLGREADLEQVGWLDDGTSGSGAAASLDRQNESMRPNWPGNSNSGDPASNGPWPGTSGPAMQAGGGLPSNSSPQAGMPGGACLQPNGDGQSARANRTIICWNNSRLRSNRSPIPAYTKTGFITLSAWVCFSGCCKGVR